MGIRKTINLNEKIEVSADDRGLSVYGDILDVRLKQAKHNELMEFDISGSFSVASRVKSLESLLGQYDEKDWPTLEKEYKKATTKAAKYIEEAVKQFEKHMELAVKSMEKDLKKF